MKAIAVLVSATQSACVLMGHSTEIDLRDRAGVSVVSGVPGAVPIAMIAPSDGPTETLLASGAFSTGPGVSASYEVYARREADGSIAVRWARPQVMNGDRYTVLAAGRTLHLPEVDAKVLVSTRGESSANLEVPSSAWLSATESEYGVPAGYLGHLDISSPRHDFQKPSVRVPFTVAVPWSDIVEMRRRNRPSRRGAAALMALSSAVFGGVGAPLAFTGDHAAVHATGGVLLGVGALVDLLLMPTLFWPSGQERVYPR